MMDHASQQNKSNNTIQTTPNNLERSPKSLNSLKLAYHCLISYLVPVIIAVILFRLLAARLSIFKINDLRELHRHLQAQAHIAIFGGCALSVILLALYLMARPRAVYLVNFSCCKPKDAPMYSREYTIKQAISQLSFNAESMEFQKKILERSGIGSTTYFPKVVSHMRPEPNMALAVEEAEMVMYGAVDDLLAKSAYLKAKDIDILVVNCSLFCPTPSLSEMIINRYGFREDVMNFNLSGMGCSAGLIAVDLAKHHLRVHRNSCALIVSTEILTLNCYQGNNRAMLVTNCLFRVGGAAILLSNRRSDRGRAKYRLVDVIRLHKGGDDDSYNCVSQEEDDEGQVGIALSIDLMNVAAKALRDNISRLAPRVLPFSELLLFVSALAGRKILGLKIAPYLPDFKLAFEHFCIHAGGRALLDAIEKNLGLNAWYMEPSRMTLYRFGNTSSSSLWYELAYSQAKGRIKRGDRVWQLAFGSGFKCNSIVWRAMRKVEPKEDEQPWLEEIHQFPVPVPKVMPLLL